jgi:hypothetical protein
MLLNNVAALDIDELDEPWAEGVRTRIHAGLFEHITGTPTNDLGHPGRSGRLAEVTPAEGRRLPDARPGRERSGWILPPTPSPRTPYRHRPESRRMLRTEVRQM